MKPSAPPVRGTMLSFSTSPCDPGSTLATAARTGGRRSRQGECTERQLRPGQQNSPANRVIKAQVCCTHGDGMQEQRASLPATIILVPFSNWQRRPPPQPNPVRAAPVLTRACPTSCRATTLFSTPCSGGQLAAKQISQTNAQASMQTLSCMHTERARNKAAKKAARRRAKRSWTLRTLESEHSSHTPAARCASSRCPPQRAGWRCQSRRWSQCLQQRPAAAQHHGHSSEVDQRVGWTCKTSCARHASKALSQLCGSRQVSGSHRSTAGPAYRPPHAPLLLRPARSAASFTRFARSAPVKPVV